MLERRLGEYESWLLDVNEWFTASSIGKLPIKVRIVRILETWQHGQASSLVFVSRESQREMRYKQHSGRDQGYRDPRVNLFGGEGM